MKKRFFSFLLLLGLGSQFVLAQSYYSSDNAQEIISFAEDHMGLVKYDYGANGEVRGGKVYYDCSSFVQAAMEDAGIDNFPRKSTDQYNVNIGIQLVGKQRIPYLQPGDLVYFDHDGQSPHIGIVVSNKRGRIRFIHCSSRFNGVAYSHLEDEYRSGFIGARRIFHTETSGSTAQDDLEPYVEPIEEEVSEEDDFVRAPDRPEEASIPGRFPIGSTKYLNYSDIKGLDGCEIRIMKNEIYARKGYKFRTNECMVAWFEKEEWYQDIPNSGYQNLTQLERENIDFLLDHQGSCGCE